MSLLTRLRGNSLAMVGAAGVVVVLVFSLLAVVLIPTGPEATPTPAPGSSAAATATPTPAPTTAPCTPGGTSGTPTSTPGAEPSSPSSSPASEIANEVLPLDALPVTIARKVEVGPLSATVQGAAGQQFSISIRTPDGKVSKVGPTDTLATISLDVVQPGTVSLTISSDPKGVATASLSLSYATSGSTSPSPAPGDTPAASPTPVPTSAPVLTGAGAGDHCAYISVYVHVDGEGSPLDLNAVVVAKRIVLDSDPTAPSIQVNAIPLPDGGYSLPVGSGASWRVLVADAGGAFQRVFDREAARQTQGGQFCPEVAIRIAPGQDKRFVFDVYRTSSLITCPGPVALIDTSQTITPDATPVPAPVYLNPVRISVDTAEALRYRSDVVSYLRSLEETNSGISPFAAAYFVIGVGGMVLFGSFAIWLLFGAQDLAATSSQPSVGRRRRRWRR